MGSVAHRPYLCAARPWKNLSEDTNITFFSCFKRIHKKNAYVPLTISQAIIPHRSFSQVLCRASARLPNLPNDSQLCDRDIEWLIHTANLADSSAGQTHPHPNAACTIVDSLGKSLSEAFLWAQGTEPAECQAVQAAGEAARGGTAYLNLEPGDCHGDSTAVEALIGSGVARVVIGLRHPMQHFQGAAVDALQQAGILVQVLGESPSSVPKSALCAALSACLAVNAPLLHKVATNKPLGVLKYAMTLDGKIATAQGHSAWVSSPQSRQQVFEVRSRSDAVIVGGQTVRRDNPQLTTRREGGHQPARIVMSRTLDLPETAKLWDVSHAPTMIMTQRGARRTFQRLMRSRGVEVVEFDFLTPEAVAAYCAERGYLQCLWECGGVLAAPAVAAGAVHRVMAFVAPKLIGGTRAPTPVGDLGFVEMTQALELQECRWEVSGPDLLLTGYLPQSGGLWQLAAAAGVLPPLLQQSDCPPGASFQADAAGTAAGTVAAAAVAGVGGREGNGAGGGAAPSCVSKWVSAAAGAQVAEFYKAWDRYGCLSNFSPHAVCMPCGAMTADRLRGILRSVPQALETCGFPPAGDGAVGVEEGEGGSREWASVEHYYQAQKFSGVSHPDAQAVVEAIAGARSPEEAARLGRRTQRGRPELLRDDWDSSKLAVMYAALRAKFSTHDGPRAMLLAGAAAVGEARAAGQRVGPSDSSAALLPAAEQQQQSLPPDATSPSSLAVGGSRTAVSPRMTRGRGGRGRGAGVVLVESSPHDFFWGRGFDGSGQNMLGRLLMCLREELVEEEREGEAS